MYAYGLGLSVAYDLKIKIYMRNVAPAQRSSRARFVGLRLCLALLYLFLLEVVSLLLSSFSAGNSHSAAFVFGVVFADLIQLAIGSAATE